MLIEQISNVYVVLVNVIGLMICLFHYVRTPRRAWVYAIVFLLGNLLSNYYWGAYMLLMDDYPNVSSLLAYFGWDVAYLPLVPLLLLLRSEDEKKFFSPLSLIPIPLNIWQFLIYIQFGGVFNNIWSGVLCTAVACLSLNSILFYLKNRERGAGKPYVAFVLFAYIFLEYVMWTSSCFDWPSEWLYPYNYANILCYVTCLALPWAIMRTYGEPGLRQAEGSGGRFQSLLQPLYIALVVICCIGGYLLAIWIRNTLDAGIAQAADTDPYSIIAVILFVVSGVLVAFSIAIILVVNYGQKAAESDKLRQEKIVAEHSNAAKSDFLANMSHEIRTPINAVLGMNEMLLREGLQARSRVPEDREDLRESLMNICSFSENIDSAGSNLLSIINDILDFSKIESGKMEIVEGDYKLSSVLNDVSNMISFKAKAKNLDFRVEVDSDLPDGLYGDEVRVRQVMTNILNNAVKYTREGSVTLSARKEADAEIAQGSTIRLVVAVKDTGIGIRKEDIDKLFNKFERVDLQKNSTVEGTGLGLAITRNLLEMMHGSVSVESEYGKGSVFTIVLPQKVVSTEPVGDFREKFEKSVQDARVYEESFRAPEARILIVDDTRMNLTVAVGLLKKTEIVIDTADSGAEAIGLTKSIRYDLILMDQRMPGMDGTEAMRHIREQTDGANRETPFICLTADAISGARSRYLAEGFTDYLTKPIDSKALEAMLMKYLPAEKITVVRDAEDAPPAEKPSEPRAEVGFAPLRAAGIDPDVGTRYCQNDEAFYRTILQEYAQSADEKMRGIRESFAAQDWNNYAILVHALKSTSKMLGAAELSGLAARMEAAANAGDGDAIRAEHDAMMAQYSAAVLAIHAILPEAGSGSDGSDDALEFLPDEDDVLEFEPDEGVSK